MPGMCGTSCLSNDFVRETHSFVVIFLVRSNQFGEACVFVAPVARMRRFYWQVNLAPTLLQHCFNIASALLQPYRYFASTLPNIPRTVTSHDS